MTASIISSPHVARANRVDGVMLQVLAALVPGILVMALLFGWGVLINIALAVVFAVVIEALFLLMRRRPILPAISDLSAVVTAVLFAISIPPALPWWLTLIGMLFAIVLVKQLYGGLGYNPFNPAMAAYVFLLVSWPVAMTTWLPPSMLAEHSLSLNDSLQLILSGVVPNGLDWDAISAATPLDAMRTQLDEHISMATIHQDPLWGLVGGRGWEWVGLAFLLGGAYLLWRRTITWHIPAAMLASLGTLATVFWIIDPSTHPSPFFHLFSGAAMLGAFFIATDPVTASTTRRGQLIYGVLIGATVFVIRTWGGYPDAVAFAVLLMNIAAPTIDYYTQPRVFGHSRGRT